MAVASITECTKRFNRLLFLTDSYTDALSSPPLRRSFNSDDEIEDIILEADELLMLDVRNTVGHPWAPTFFALSTALVHGDKIPASDAPISKVQWATTSGGTYQDSEEADKADIVEAIKDYTLFGASAADTYGYHIIIDGQLFTTSPYVKVTQSVWTRTSACQSPQSYTTAIILTAIALAPKEGLNQDLLNFASQQSMQFRSMIRSGAMLLPTVTQYGLAEVAP